MGTNVPFYVTALYNAIFGNMSPTRSEYLLYWMQFFLKNIQVQ
jgi:hypothetical protein